VDTQRLLWGDSEAFASPPITWLRETGADRTRLDLAPALVKQAWAYFNDVQTKDIKYEPLIAAPDQPVIAFNKDKMERFLPEVRKYYYDPARYKTYLEQLGIVYPTVKEWDSARLQRAVHASNLSPPCSRGIPLAESRRRAVFPIALCPMRSSLPSA
jgi:hypothetical protein